MEQNRFSWEFNIIFVSIGLEGSLSTNRLFFPKGKDDLDSQPEDSEPLTRFAHKPLPTCCNTSFWAAGMLSC